MENNKSDNLIVVENSESVYDTNSTLQDNFQKFLKLRKELRKSQLNSRNENNQNNHPLKINLVKENKLSFRDDTERMHMLRKKFIEKSISYLGVPYGKKYLEPSHPLYNSPIFLDCCGLVRQCVNDLTEEFGFMLGRWNQAYQFDILPEEISFNELEEGDLIFYEANYHPEKGWKSQPHNMVHVEIFLGGKETPEKTIAARDRLGVVEYNDTYQFTSENYYDIKYHFRSINTWLRGIHKSICNEHKWHDELLDNKPNKFSLFNCDAEEENN
jgi:hypothetical protein